MIHGGKVHGFRGLAELARFLAHQPSPRCNGGGEMGPEQKEKQEKLAKMMHEIKDFIKQAKHAHMSEDKIKEGIERIKAKYAAGE